MLTSGKKHTRAVARSAMVLFLVGLTYAADGPENLFVALPFSKIGGSQKFSSANISYFSNIIRVAPADLDGDGDMDIVMICGRRYPYGGLNSGDINDTYTSSPKKDRDFNPLSVGDYLFGYDAGPTPFFSSTVKTGIKMGYTARNLAWLENDGMGHFALRFITAATFQKGTDVKTRDMDMDGDLDIVVWAGPESSVHWYRNTLVSGVPTFAEITLISGGNYWGTGPTNANFFSGDIGDLNGDGYPEVASGPYSTSISATNYKLSAVVFSSGSVTGPIAASGSFNDTAPDNKYPSAESGTTTRGVWTPQGSHFERLPSGFEEGTNDVTLVDFDGDSRLDLILPSIDFGFVKNVGDPSYPNHFIGTIRKIGDFFLARRLDVGDLNNDGFLDVVFAGSANNASTSDNRLGAFITKDSSRTSWDKVMFPHGDEILGVAPSVFPAGAGWDNDYPEKNPVDVALADVNGDGFLDVIVLSRSNKFSTGYRSGGKDCLVVVYVARHRDTNGDGTIKANELSWDEVPLVEPFVTSSGEWASQMSLAVADFDGDKDLDILRSTRVAPLVLFENVWNTHRRVRVTTKVKGGVFDRSSTEYFNVGPYSPSSGRSPVRGSAGKTEGKP